MSYSPPREWAPKQNSGNPVEIFRTSPSQLSSTALDAPTEETDDTNTVSTDTNAEETTTVATPSGEGEAEAVAANGESSEASASAEDTVMRCFANGPVGKLPPPLLLTCFDDLH